MINSNEFINFLIDWTIAMKMLPHFWLVQFLHLIKICRSRKYFPRIGHAFIRGLSWSKINLNLSKQMLWLEFLNEYGYKCENEYANTMRVFAKKYLHCICICIRFEAKRIQMRIDAYSYSQNTIHIGTLAYDAPDSE